MVFSKFCVYNNDCGILKINSSILIIIMDSSIETINLGGDMDDVKLNIGEEHVNFESSIPGVELLANNSKQSAKVEQYDSLDDLEKSLDELELTNDVNVNGEVANNTFFGMDNPVKPAAVTNTWDGYAKYDNIPGGELDKISKEDTLREKFKYVRLLEDLEKKGVSLSKKYDMESSLLEMQGEYETILKEKEKSNSVKFQGKMLMAAVTGLEFMNNKFDPFDIQMDGWGEQVNENITEYDEIFGELHEKYKSKGKMAPEIKLMFQLAGSAIMVHMTNTMFKSSMPGMDDIMRQNPDLMQQFTKAAVDQMSKNNEGFGNFANMANMMPGSRPDLNYAQEDVKLNKSPRQEMKGPNDISEILSGLKTKEAAAEAKQTLDDKQPKSKRRSRGDKNTISLNL